MNSVSKDIFRAVFENKWLSIEYNNQSGENTKYWIGIKQIIIAKEPILVVEGLHVALCTITELRIKINSIKASYIIDGSYYQTPEALKRDIEINQSKYNALFCNVANLKILNYLSDCNKLDSTPYQAEYSLIALIDDEKVKRNDFSLSDEQYKEIIRSFQISVKDNKVKNCFKQLVLNILSINTKEGLYVLAYRKLHLDVMNKRLIAEKDVTVCSEFSINGVVASAKYFLDDDELYLLNDFENNLSVIEDKIIENSGGKNSVDDVPYIIAIERSTALDLNNEYSAIQQMYEDDKVTIPIKAFFGELVKQPIRRKDYPITLIDKRINLDQLLAIHNSIKYPLTYVQGPPGTGKTNTIINTILTAFFNGKTLLFSSYNNHPIDSVFVKLSSMDYIGRVVPFPILRLGNNEKMLEALNYIGELYKQTENIKIYDDTLNKYSDTLKNNAKQLTELMGKYEEVTELKERKETIEKVLETNDDFNFQVQLQGQQLNAIEERIKEIGKITDEEALKLVVENDVFKKFIYYKSATYIKHLSEPKYEDLLAIIASDNEEEKIKEFNRYISNDDNLEKLLKVFPIIATTCISAHKLGSPGVHFDMTVIDEASQCNTAMSLVPILRGENLLLVGDPQQLNPVILLDEMSNETLKNKYNISNEYDYIKNSIYKTYLAADSVSQEILLHNHYRCHKKIIDFCNKKYYNNKLSVESNNTSERPLVCYDIKNNISEVKNAAPKEAKAVVEYVKKYPDKNIGIITPFVHQKEMINGLLKDAGITNVTCGTVHAFQGDEKDEILFSLAVTDKTTGKTYSWLKQNKELINVAVSRGKNSLVLFGSDRDINRLHTMDPDGDDIYELVQYAKTNGASEVTTVETKSRALGIKPYSTETEEALLVTLNHALGNVLKQDKKCVVKREVGIAQVFRDNTTYSDLFYSGRFDFVVYERTLDNKELPVFAIELDGKEHYTDDVVKARDAKKNQICKSHGFDLIRIDNTYARRYNYLKEILIDYFKS